MINEAFRKFSNRTSELVGTSWAFIVAVTILVVWGISGPAFHFSDTWQLIINTGTTIVTFLMVFLIQNTQNRDAKAIHLKLDELIRGVEGARNSLIDLEKLPDEDLKRLEEAFQRLRNHQHDDVEDCVKEIEQEVGHPVPPEVARERCAEEVSDEPSRELVGRAA